MKSFVGYDSYDIFEHTLQLKVFRVESATSFFFLFFFFGGGGEGKHKTENMNILSLHISTARLPPSISHGKTKGRWKNVFKSKFYNLFSVCVVYLHDVNYKLFRITSKLIRFVETLSLSW